MRILMSRSTSNGSETLGIGPNDLYFSKLSRIIRVLQRNGTHTYIYLYLSLYLFIYLYEIWIDWFVIRAWLMQLGSWQVQNLQSRLTGLRPRESWCHSPTPRAGVADEAQRQFAIEPGRADTKNASCLGEGGRSAFHSMQAFSELDEALPHHGVSLLNSAYGCVT